MRVAQLTMVRNEADLILPNLLHHYNCGVRDFFLMDNGSRDGTWDAIEKFRQAHSNCTIIVISDAEPGFFQARRMTMLAEMAHDAGCDWVMPLDADELLVLPPGETIQGVLETVPMWPPFGYIRVYWFTVHPTVHDDPAIVNPFRRLGYRSLLPERHNKVILRFHKGMRFSIGSHELQGEQFPELQPPGQLRYYHYPYRSRKQLEEKILQMGQAFERGQYSLRVVAQTYPVVQTYLDYKQEGVVVFDRLWQEKLKTGEGLLWESIFRG